MFDLELESFKISIDLRAFAVSEGYVLDRKESWRGSAVMRHPNGHKIIISRMALGHHTFYSVRRVDDSRTIIDFLKNRKRLSLSPVCKECRASRWRPAAALP